MNCTGPRKHVIVASAALGLGGIVVAALVVLLSGPSAAPGDPGPSRRQPEPVAPSAYSSAEVLEEPIPEPPTATVTRSLREPGVTSAAVGEHPNAAVSPIQTATVVLEPAGEFRRTVVPGTPLECDRFRPMVQATGEWDPDVVLAFVWRESQCNERLVSPTNDWGLMQLNATCWAGRGSFGLPGAQRLPDEAKALEVRCDGNLNATDAGKWCLYAKEEKLRTGRRPSSPCDAWLDPETNLAVAHQIWSIKGWQPWCFHETSQSTPACQAAAALAPQDAA